MHHIFGITRPVHLIPGRRIDRVAVAIDIYRGFIINETTHTHICSHIVRSPYVAGERCKQPRIRLRDPGGGASGILALTLTLVIGVAT